MIRNRFGTEPEPVSCGFAAAVADGERVAIMLPAKSEDDGVDVREFGLGSVLIWGRHHKLPVLVIAPSDRAGGLARQAEAFAQLSVAVLDGTTLADPEVHELAPIPALSEPVLAHHELIESVGAVAVDDFGRLIAEVEGLEIGRVEGEDAQLEIGVGTADRVLHGYVHSHQDAVVSLQRAADTVREIRQLGPAGHPLNRRARQRWLRWSAFQDPSLVGAQRLEMVPPLEERVLQLGPEPCAAVDPDTNALFVFSAGIDPEVVPAATDYRRRHQPSGTVIVTSPADAFLATQQIAQTAGIDLRSVPAPY